MQQRKKIGIMGGTFNPIHCGHLLLAEEAKHYCSLDEVLFMPSGNSYMKNDAAIADGSLRLAMTAAAIENNPYFSLSSLEIDRGGFTYTCDTLKELGEKHPSNRYYFIIGADNLFTLRDWKMPEVIMSSCTLIAAARGEKTELQIAGQAKKLQQEYQADIIILPPRRIDISSSEIREKISKGESVRYMIPDKVNSLIQENHLYQDTGGNVKE